MPVLPPKYHRRLWTTNIAEEFLSVERLIEEIWRRERIVRIFPPMEAAHRLIGARCAEQHEEWSTGRRYLTMDAFFNWECVQTKTLEAEPDPTATPLPHPV